MSPTDPTPTVDPTPDPVVTPDPLTPQPAPDTPAPAPPVPVPSWDDRVRTQLPAHTAPPLRDLLVWLNTATPTTSTPTTTWPAPIEPDDPSHSHTFAPSQITAWSEPHTRLREAVATRHAQHVAALRPVVDALAAVATPAAPPTSWDFTLSVCTGCGLIVDIKSLTP